MILPELDGVQFFKPPSATYTTSVAVTRTSIDPMQPAKMVDPVDAKGGRSISSTRTASAVPPSSADSANARVSSRNPRTRICAVDLQAVMLAERAGRDKENARRLKRPDLLNSLGFERCELGQSDATADNPQGAGLVCA